MPGLSIAPDSCDWWAELWSDAARGRGLSDSERYPTGSWLKAALVRFPLYPPVEDLSCFRSRLRYCQRLRTAVHQIDLVAKGIRMKNGFLMIGGLCAAIAALVVVESRRRKPVEELAHKLEVAWADHHTVV